MSAKSWTLATEVTTKGSQLPSLIVHRTGMMSHKAHETLALAPIAFTTLNSLGTATVATVNKLSPLAQCYVGVMLQLQDPYPLLLDP